MAKVIFQNVNKVYRDERGGESAVIKNFNLEVEDREFLVATGPPGCGKSTILRLIAGLEESSGGDISIGQRRVNGVAPKDRDIAMVFQNSSLYPFMSVFDNMAFGLKLQKLSKREIKKRVTDAAATLGLAELLDRKTSELSLGQCQQVAVGCAIARQPKVILFDEPLAGLDVESRVRMRAELTRLHQRLDTTVIYATNDLGEAMAMGTRIVVMNHGEIQQVDVLSKLYNEPKNLFVAGFLGNPPMNFIHGTLSGNAEKLIFREDNRGTVELSFEDRPGAARFVGDKVVLGVRPEDCHVIPPGAHVEGQALKAIADLIEPTGAETFFHLQTGAHTLISRNAGMSEPANMGHRVQFRIAPERVHLFDPVSTQRII